MGAFSLEVNAVKDIRTKRLSQKLSLRTVAESVGRTAMWLSLVERRRLTCTPEVQARILAAIKRLGQFKAEVSRRKNQLTSDLRLSNAQARGSGSLGI